MKVGSKVRVVLLSVGRVEILLVDTMRKGLTVRALLKKGMKRARELKLDDGWSWNIIPHAEEGENDFATNNKGNVINVEVVE